MEHYKAPSPLLTKEDLIQIIRRVPDSIVVYDRNLEQLICSDLVQENDCKKREMKKTASPQVLTQFRQSEQEMLDAVEHVMHTGEPMTFIHTSPHYAYPTLSTLRPVFDEDGSVKFVLRNGRSQAVVNKFSREYSKLQQHLENNQESLKLLSRLHLKNTDMVAESPAMRHILKTVHRIAQTDSTVTIVGESGTGKEVIANTIHKNSLRKDNIFVPVNCSAIPPELMESEFFGYAPGAFTGAKSGGRVGLFELANHGTLFLDEIGELPLSLQPKFLRALDSGEIRPVGANKAKKVDVRIIVATNRNLEDMVKNKQFREDLYYRLHIIPLRLPALRDRREDILPLAEHYLSIYNKKHNRHCYLTDSAKAELLRYNWPGNIRELRNLMERLVIISEMDAILQMQVLSLNAPPQQPQSAPASILSAEEPPGYYQAVSQFEKAYIEQMLYLCDGNVAQAAERMGVHKSMLYKKIKKLKEDQV